MREINKIRFVILCLLLALVGGTSLFIGRISANVLEAQEELVKMENFAQDAREDFISLSVIIQETFIKTIEDNWESELSFYYSAPVPVAIERLKSSLDGVMNQAFNSMIVAFKDDQGLIYAGYNHDEYKQHLHRINWDEVEIGQTQVLFDQGGPAGTENRLYISSTILDSVSKQIEVYVFFEEAIMLDAMIESLSMDKLQKTSASIENVLEEVVLFMMVTIALAAAIAFYLRKIYVDTGSKCPYFGNELCHYTWVVEELEKQQKEESSNCKKESQQ